MKVQVQALALQLVDDAPDPVDCIEDAGVGRDLVGVSCELFRISDAR
jgi:hypothetical protein